jgi:hypothetical protein
MLPKHSAYFGLAGLLAMFATPASATNYITTATASATCSSYTLNLCAVVPVGDSYTFTYSISTQSGTVVNASIPFTANMNPYCTTVTGPLSLPAGTSSLSGSATLYDGSGEYAYPCPNSSGFACPISFSPSTLTCPTPPPACSTGPESLAYNVSESTNNAGEIVWFNSHFKLQGTVPSTSFTVNVTNQSITFGTSTLAVPDATITFSPTANCASTTFDTATNRWVTTIPLAYATKADEIFSAGLAYILPSSFPQNVKNVTWNATFTSPDAPSLHFQFQYGAANYLTSDSHGDVFPLTALNQPDYNAMAIDPVHNAPTCAGYDNGNHAGTPENQAVKNLVTGGGSGGGGSNWTGSWSSTPTYVCAPQ